MNTFLVYEKADLKTTLLNLLHFQWDLCALCHRNNLCSVDILIHYPQRMAIIVGLHCNQHRF